MLDERFQGEVREGRPLAELVDELEPRERDGLEQLGFVLLRPDSLAAGQGPAIVRHLTDELGLEPVAVRVLASIPPALADALYHRQSRIPRTNVWLQHAVLGSGPAAVLLVVSPESRDPSLTEWLQARKGPTSTLERAADGAVRSRFGRTSGPHAVVHVPEDVPALVVEVSLFFPWETVRAAAGGRLPPPTPCAGCDLTTLEPTPGRTVFQAVLKVKRRIAAALAVRLREAAWVAELRELTVEADAALEPLDYLEQRTRLLEFAVTERPLLEIALADLQAHLGAPDPQPSRAAAWRSLRETAAPLELVFASWFLSGHEAYGGDGGERLFTALAEHDVPLSPAQRTLLAAGLASDLHPRARVDGQRLWPLGADPGGAAG